MRLVVFRHGIAQDKDDPRCPPDPERRLTSKGVRRTRQAAKGLAALGVAPDAVLSSPYLRARETADIAVDVLRLRLRVVETPALLPESSPSNLVRVLQTIRAGEVLLAGHAPHVDRAVARLLGSGAPLTELKKAGAACLESSGGKRWRLVWLLGPEALRLLGKGGKRRRRDPDEARAGKDEAKRKAKTEARAAK
jgi:phosphohistidine phosphatase